jgi:outer membrane protein TolC
MQESIQKSLHNHPDIKTFMLKVKQSQKGYKAAYADYLPQINAQVDYNPIQTFALPVNGSFNTIDDDSWNVGVNLKQKLWDFSKTAAKVEASMVDKDISTLSLAEAKVLLAYKVKTLYKQMVVQKEAIGVRQKDLKVKQAYYQQAKALVIQGLKTKADESRFLSEVYVARDNLAQAKTAYEKAKSSLSIYMGETIPKHVKLQHNILKKRAHFGRDLQQEVIANNLQVKIDALNIQKNKLLHKSTKASHYGSIDLVASYNQLDTLNNYDSKFVGISLNIPLYSGGRMSAQEQQAKIGTQIAQEQQASKILALKEELAALLLDIKHYNQTIAAKKAQLKAVINSQKVLQARYKEGLTTYIELLDAATQVLASRLGILEAYYAKSVTINRIEYLKGKI